MRRINDGIPLDPRVSCTGWALQEALPVFPPNPTLSVAVETIIAESEEYAPDIQRLTTAWDTALEILIEMSDQCQIAALGMVFIEMLEDRPLPAPHPR